MARSLRSLSGSIAAAPTHRAIFAPHPKMSACHQPLSQRQPGLACDPHLNHAGFIAAGGLESTDDIGLMARHWAHGSVMQDGQETRLIWKEVEPGKIKLTTELHRDQEAEFIALV